MKSDDGISVIIPVYNGAPYLGQAIESVLTQTRPAGEVIVVDDGSEGGSAEVALSFGSAVRLVRTGHAGRSSATNRGVNEAKGRWIAFLDADDLWTPRKLEIQSLAAEDPHAPEMLFGMAENFREDKAPEPAIPGISKCTLFIERRRWLDVGPLDETLSMGEFVDWFSRARDRGFAFVVSNEVLLRRRIHATNSGITSVDQRWQFALVAKRNLDRRRTRAARGPDASGPAKT